MGSIGGLVGLSGGAAGTGFGGPQQAQLTAPTSSDQINQAYTGTQNTMQGQQSLLQALQAQNGLQNQNQVYGQLQGVASGAVNPAQAQFNQNTAQNVANQAALMAGQRGASSNVGLMARQAAQQGAATQQQAVGQEASQQAQNQIAAIGQAGQLATTQAGQQIAQTNSNVSAQQAEQQNLLNAIQGYNTNQVGMQSNINSANAGLANTQMGGQQKIVGGIMNGAGAAMGGAGGGDVVKFAGGGTAAPSLGTFNFTQSDPNMAQSGFGKYIGSTTNNKAPSNQDPEKSAAAPSQDPLEAGASKMGSGIVNKIKGGSSGSNVSMDDGSVAGPANNFGAAQLTMPAVGGANGGMAKDFRTGGKVNADSKNQKAVKTGNNYANDKIPAVLSEHEIVLPRSVTLSKDPVAASAKFVANVISKRKTKK